MSKNLRLFALPLISVFLMTSCSSKPKSDKIVDAVKLYTDGLLAMEQKKFDQAGSIFENLYYQHPGNPITPYGEIMEAYALYNEGRYQDARDVLRLFLEYHPTHMDADYAYYLMGMCSYAEISDAYRDSSKSYDTKKIFENLIKKFPNSEYSKKASNFLLDIDVYIATYSMAVGRQSIKTGDYITAIKRFKYVVDNYTHTPQLQEALYRMVECYSAFGMKDEALIYLVKLEPYKNGTWYPRATLLVQ